MKNPAARGFRESCVDMTLTDDDSKPLRYVFPIVCSEHRRGER
jgi:hypothetical protein